MSTALCLLTVKHLLATVKDAHVCRLQDDCATGQHTTAVCAYTNCKSCGLAAAGASMHHMSFMDILSRMQRGASCRAHARTLVLVAAGIEFLQAATTPSPFRRSKHVDALANQLRTAAQASSCSGFGRAA